MHDPLLLQCFLTLLLMVTADQQCTVRRRTSSLQFNVTSAKNETGHRHVEVALVNEMEDTGQQPVTVSVNQWSEECGSLETVGLRVAAVTPGYQQENTNTSLAAVEQSTEQVTEPEAQDQATPEGYYLLPGLGFYKLVEIFSEWEEVKRFCEQEGAKMVAPGSRHEWELLMLLFNHWSISYPSWLGIRRHGDKWKTLDGDEVAHDEIPWISDQPDDDSDCIYISYAGVGDWACNGKVNILCKKPL